MSLHRFAGLKLKGLIGVGPLFDGSMNLKEKKKKKPPTNEIKNRLGLVQTVSFTDLHPR